MTNLISEQLEKCREAFEAEYMRQYLLVRPPVYLHSGVYVSDHAEKSWQIAKAAWQAAQSQVDVHKIWEKMEALKPAANSPELSERAYCQAVDDCIALLPTIAAVEREQVADEATAEIIRWAESLPIVAKMVRRKGDGWSPMVPVHADSVKADFYTAAQYIESASRNILSLRPYLRNTQPRTEAEREKLVEALEDARSAFALFIQHFPSPDTSHLEYRVRCARVSEEAIRDIDAALAVIERRKGE